MLPCRVWRREAFEATRFLIFSKLGERPVVRINDPDLRHRVGEVEDAEMQFCTSA